MLKVCLIAIYAKSVPPVEELGICSIASFLRKVGYEVLVIGEHEEKLNYNEIVEFKADVVGFPVYSITKDAILRVSEKLKQIIPKVFIVTGGYFATYYGEEMLSETNHIDFAIRGEGEIAFYNLLKSLECGSEHSEINGLIYRSGSNIITNKRQEMIQNIASLPWPSRDLLVKKKFKVANISSSRGCTSRCSFCCSLDFWGKWRGRDVNDVVNEMEYIYNNYNIREFYFTDNSFEDPGINIERVRSIAEQIIKKGLIINYRTFMRTGFYKKASNDDMKLLKASGLLWAFLGNESANQEDIEIYGKKSNEEECYKSIDFFQKHDVYVYSGFINFNPYSTFEKLHKNMQFLKKYNYYAASSHLKRLSIYKGTSIYSRIKSDGLLIEGDKYDNDLGYRFLDERIACLANYLNDYYKIFKYNSDNLSIHFARDSYVKILGLKRFINLKNDNTASIINDNKNAIKNIISELSNLIGSSYKLLLNLAENGWNKDIADDIMSNYLTKEIILNINKRVKSLNLNMIMKLNKEEPNILELFRNQV